MGKPGSRIGLQPPKTLKFTVSKPDGIEVGYVKDCSIDMDLGDTNDFEIQMGAGMWNGGAYNYGHRLYIPGTEYGGLLEERSTETASDTIIWRGDTWRGLLAKKLIHPPEGQTHLTVSGDANKIIRDIIGSRFGSLFYAETGESGIQVRNYKFDRFCTVLSGLEKMLASVGAALKIRYIQGEPGIPGGAVNISAVRVTDWSDELECSQDGKLNFTTKEYRRGINHLVCAGSGEGEERLVLHLYVQKDGSIGEKQYYTGLEEREALYSYTSVDDAEQLKKDGEERLKELMNYKQMDVFIRDVDIDIGDIVGGRDRITGMSLQKPVVNKILRVEKGNVSVEYKLKGEE
ncbi:siphovirus ReqiPepy6 Gp37-like family protein [Mediterraneibacter agrestimuris]|uniref:siphovirus ReqiPepy6 Gp37-like family protein n=1 Tax=Mediterraneibacter agrestimuris TaxID=2941333 RepID=UPI00203A7E22|nr:siphovirus ReqiPepy6 Gp37-like family protein [Mediterraneibacter agrestimuris]